MITLHDAVSLERYQSPDAHLFFGYYDVTPFNRHADRILATRLPKTAVPGRSAMEVGWFRRGEGDAFRPFGSTMSWCWQMGCRLQWFPAGTHGDTGLVLFNAFLDGAHRGLLVDSVTGDVRQVLPEPVYVATLDGRLGYTLDFSRLQRLRPGYGYANLEDATRDQDTPEMPGIAAMDMATGEVTPLWSLREAARLDPQPTMDGAQHYFNHLCPNPSGDRLAFFHLWIKDGRQHSRMLTCDALGGRFHVFKDTTYVSHYWWRNDTQIVCYSRTSRFKDAYLLFPDFGQPDEDIAPGVFSGDGHCSFSPDGRWMLTDGYPDKDGYQGLILFDGKKRIDVFRQYCPITGPIDARCDMHPRLSPDGRLVALDSLAEGVRKLYVLDVSRIVDRHGER